MAHLTADKSEVNARIVFWGIGGAGVSTNLRVIHDKLRPDHRGELRSVPTRLDPSTHYELLPIELGRLNGLRTLLQIVGVPGGAEHAPTRKQLLDRIDGLVFVVDAQAHRLDENRHSLDELRDALGAYGRSLEELPLVVQYNKRDLCDPYAIEELHRKLAIRGAAVFESVARDGTGVLQTLTTISKRVIRMLRESDLETQPSAPPPSLEPAEAVAPEPTIEREPTVETAPPAAHEPEPTPDPAPLPADPVAPVDLLESAILAEGEDGLDPQVEDAALAAQDVLDQPWDAVSEELKSTDGARIGPDFELVSVGTASRAGQRAVRIPLVLGNPEGETVTLSLTIQLDPLLDDGGE